MKKILLLMSAVFLMHSSDLFAQNPTITNITISHPILCFGGTGGMVIDIDNPAATNYSYLVGYYATPTFFVSQFSAALTTGLQQSPNGFNANVDYFVRLVDSTAYYNGNSGSPNGTSTAGIYDELGPTIFS